MSVWLLLIATLLSTRVGQVLTFQLISSIPCMSSLPIRTSSCLAYPHNHARKVQSISTQYGRNDGIFFPLVPQSRNFHPSIFCSASMIERYNDNNNSNENKTIEENGNELSIIAATDATSNATGGRYLHQNTDESTNNERGYDENSTIGMESGWVNLGRYLRFWSLSSYKNKSEYADVSSYTSPKDANVDPVYFEGTSFSSKDEAFIDDECDVIDVEACIDEDFTPLDFNDKNATSASIKKEANITAAFDEAKNNVSTNFFRLGMQLIFQNGNRLWNMLKQVYDLKAIENERGNASSLNLTPSLVEIDMYLDIEHSNNTEEQLQPEISSFETENTNPHKKSLNDQYIGYRKRRRRRQTKSLESSPFLSSLENKDIYETTLLKQKKWQRRRKRALILLHTAKNAVLLFVLTFLAGNVMNQFVDLDDEGSFEVHFGKVLSPSIPTTSSFKTQKGQSKSGAFHSISTKSRLNTFDASHTHALRLVSKAVRTVGPAVVRVETETDLDYNVDELQSKIENNVADTNPDTDNEDRGDIFDGIPDAPILPNDDQNNRIDFGQGSGIIINDEGYILTNAHVVDGASRVYILLTDGRRFRAEVRGCDDIVDVAVLKVIPENAEKNGIEDSRMDLPVAELGDSDQLEVGQFVTAIGSPGGLDNTCTIGIISGLKRCPKVVGIPDKAGVLEYIQTDASINQGNSGGPLVDVESGHIVGINTCIRANMEGTSFAIPINKVMGIVDDLSLGKRITHGYLGVQMTTMNPLLARYCNMLQSEHNALKIPENKGVMIEKVFKNSPSQIGGLKEFDFVIEIDGQHVETANDAHLIIDRAVIGQDINIVVMRGDTKLTLHVKPEDLSTRLKQLRQDRLNRKMKIQ